MISKQTNIYIAGHTGMVGSAVWSKLESEGYTNLIGETSKVLDLRNQQSVFKFYKKEQPEVVIDAAAKVGGILANNDFPYQFLMENMQIQNNLIDGAFKEVGVELEFKGKGSNGKAFVKACNDKKYQLKIGKEVLSIDSNYYRPTEVDYLVGDPTKAKVKLGWKPEHNITSLVSEMMQSDLISFKNN